MKKRVFFQNAAIMTLTTLLLRAVGLVFRVYISNRIGAEGMGLYQMILSVYMLASSFASSGLTTAVTRLCTDHIAMHNHPQARRILHTGMGLGVLVGVLSAIVVAFGSKPIAVYVLRDERATLSLRAMAFSLPFMGISCCIKGYFLAKRKVNAASFSQILEQAVRIAVIVLLLSIRSFQSVSMATFAILIGDAVAEAASCLYIVLVYVFEAWDGGTSTSKLPRCVRQLIAIAAPITVGRYMNSGLRTVENIAIPYTLTQYCHSRESALSEFGKLKGMALPLIFFPSGILNAFSALLIPEVSEANALGQRKQLKRTVSKSITVTLLFAYGIGGAFWMLAEPISLLVYSDVSIARYLRFLAPLTPIMYMESVAVGLLKGLNQQNRSLLYSTIDSISRILLIFCLLPSSGMNGMLALMVFSNLLTGGLHLHRLLTVSGCRFDAKRWLWAPTLGVVIAIIAANGMQNLPGVSSWNLLVLCLTSMVVFSVLYTAVLMLCGCIRREDLTVVIRSKA